MVINGPQLFIILEKWPQSLFLIFFIYLLPFQVMVGYKKVNTNSLDV